jgi:flagellar hook protein FlgE
MTDISRKAFDKALLDKCMTRDAAVISEEYDKLSSRAVINFRCSCGKAHSKQFAAIERKGAYCYTCTFEKRNAKAKLTNLDKCKAFDKALLDKCMTRDAAVISEEYDKLSCRAVINFRCSCGKAHSKQFLAIERTGAYCYTCTFEKSNAKAKLTNLDKFGAEHAIQTKAIQSKREETYLKKFGVKHAMKNQLVKDKHKNTMLTNWGVENPSQNPTIKQKKKDTCLKNLGVEYPWQSEEVLAKIKATNLERYKVEYPSQNPTIRQKQKDTCLKNLGVEYPMQSEEVLAKTKATNLERYKVEYPSQNPTIKQKQKDTCLKNLGVEYPWQSEEVLAKIKATNLERYKVEYPSQNPTIRQKQKDTCLKNLGVEYPMQSEEVLAKTKATNLERYKVEYPSQNALIFEKAINNSFKYKIYTMPSGSLRKVQGYEPFALDELLKLYTEEQTKTDRADIPRIEYMLDNNKRYYFPDIFIPHENRIIEVKSTWTFAIKNEIIMSKGRACKDSGYNFEIWVYAKKGDKKIIPF